MIKIGPKSLLIWFENMQCLWNKIEKKNCPRDSIAESVLYVPIEAATLFTIEPFEHNEVRSRFFATTKDKKEKREALHF